jgi:uncharacterized membrane protein
MSELIVLNFDSERGAMAARDRLLQLQKQELIKLADAAVVIRKPDGKPKVKQLYSLVGAGALGGAFWGMLIGLFFLAPWAGAAVGALAGGLSGKLGDVGIDDDFIKEVGNTIEPGHSALFLMVIRATEDRVIPELKDMGATVLRTSLSQEDEEKLRDAFGSAEIPA